MNRLLKKTASLFLLLALTVSLCIPAAAAGSSSSDSAKSDGPVGIISAMSVELDALVKAADITRTDPASDE